MNKSISLDALKENQYTPNEIAYVMDEELGKVDIREGSSYHSTQEYVYLKAILLSIHRRNECREPHVQWNTYQHPHKHETRTIKFTGSGIEELPQFLTRPP